MVVWSELLILKEQLSKTQIVTKNPSYRGISVAHLVYLLITQIVKGAKVRLLDLELI